MPDISPRLALPYLQPSQAQKHVTHNDALRRLDLLVQLVVVQFGADVPPGQPGAGRGLGAGGCSAGRLGGAGRAAALWEDTGWSFVAPQEGWRA